MNREQQEYFGAIPKIHTKRSRFNLGHSVTNSFNVGDIIPIKAYEVLPGDTFEVSMAEVIRMSTPIYPVMDNLVYDLYWFFVPNRLLWEHWQAFWGENDNPWIQQNEYEIPQILSPEETGWAGGTVADYLGIPTGVPGLSHSQLPFRAYIKIWNDWFRSENVDYCAELPINDTTIQGINAPAQGQTYVNNQKKGITPLRANKTMDYFTACLPSPQKGPSISLPLGESARVMTQASNFAATGTPLNWGLSNGDNFDTNVYSISAAGQTGPAITSLGDAGAVGGRGMEPINLVADLGNATAATVRELRTAFAIQKYYERLSQGSRYIEWLANIFGVESSDARLQRSEYLGGARYPINMSQIIQTSSTDNTSPQGHASGFSCTIEKNDMFIKSFEEHGILMCLGVARIEHHTYQQGLERWMSRKKWSDFYNPYFAFLSNQPVYNKEIYAQGTSEDDEVFGYNEAWAEYRTIPNTVTAAFRSNYEGGSLDSWHYADDYNSLPYLSSPWLKENAAEIDRTLAVEGAYAHQLIGNFYIDMKATRPMPAFSTPGLIDHV